MPEYSILIGGKAGEGLNKAGIIIAQGFMNVALSTFLPTHLSSEGASLLLAGSALSVLSWRARPARSFTICATHSLCSPLASPFSAFSRRGRSGRSPRPFGSTSGPSRRISFERRTGSGSRWR
jgi:hypothetical protein